MTPLNYFNQQNGWQNQNSYNLNATATPQGAWATGTGDNINTVAKSTPDANFALASDPNSGSFACAYDGIWGKMAQSFAAPTNQNSLYGNNFNSQIPLANTVPLQGTQGIDQQYPQLQQNFAPVAGNNINPQGIDQQYPQLQQNFAPVTGNNNNPQFQPQQMMQMFQQIMQFINAMMQMIMQMMGGMMGGNSPLGNNMAYANPNGSNTALNGAGNNMPYSNPNSYNTGSNGSGNYYPNYSGSSGNTSGSSSASAYYSPNGSSASASSSSGTGSASASASASSNGASASASSSSDDISSYSSNGGTCKPVDGARMSSGFGMRIHPITGKPKFHKGVDYAAPTGTTIKSTQDGIVEFAGNVRGYGNRVVVNHGNGVKTTYSHCNSINVNVGQKVGSGQKIATVGSTGNSTGPHLHYEKIVNGKHVNPA